MKSISPQHLTIQLVRLIAIGLALALLAALPRSGYSAPQATTRYVSLIGGDGNDCLTPATACEHIQAAINKSSSGDTISIAAGTYLENLEINDISLTLQGQGVISTTVNGNGQDRVLFLSDDDAATPMSVVVSGLSLQNGQSSGLGGAINNETVTVYLTIVDSEIANSAVTGIGGGGGGIFNQGFLKLVNVVVRDNSANNGYGGGIYNLGEADLDATTVTNNQAGLGGGGIRNTNLMTITSSLIGVNNRSNGGDGGGIYNVGTGSKLTLFYSAINDNQAIAARGGGIYNESILISSGALISGNLATQEGGGIYNATSGQAAFTGGSLRGNESQAQAGGAFFNGGIANLTGALVTGNRAGTSGGGIDNTGTLSVDSNTITYNTAEGQPGGGINNHNALTLIRSAVAYNAANVTSGGGLHNSGTAQLTNVTISENGASGSGGGIQNTGSTLTIQFSTISDNSSPSLDNVSGSIMVGSSILTQTVGNACAGTISSDDYNIDTGTSCGFGQPHDLSSTSLQLGPLRNNGGDSPTRAIGFSSAAVNSASSTCPSTDQRGIIRPQFDICDRGAYEVAGYTNSTPLPIPAHQCVNSTITIGDQFAVGLLLAGVNLNHPNRAELAIRLLSPGANRVYLLGPAANSGQDLDTLFDDSAAGVVPPGDQIAGSPFFDYIYKSSAPLLQFRGASMKGIWKLEICNSGSSTGTLNRWVIIIPEFSDFNTYMPLIRRSSK